MIFLRALVLTVLLSLLGCGSRAQTAPAPADPSLAAVRGVLQQIAAGTPLTPSHRGGLLSGIANLNKTAPEKAALLDKDARELLQMAGSNPQGAQAKAQEMVEKLDAMK